MHSELAIDLRSSMAIADNNVGYDDLVRQNMCYYATGKASVLLDPCTTDHLTAPCRALRGRGGAGDARTLSP